MNVRQAIEHANLILTEEQERPNTRYLAAGRSFSEQIAQIRDGTYKGALAQIDGEELNLDGLRKQTKRFVLERTGTYTLTGENYSLLHALFGQLHEGDHDAFVDALLILVRSGGLTSTSSVYHYPTLDGQVSCLPLVAEFLVRVGAAERLFLTLGSVQGPTLGLALLLLQVEEMISLNFSVLSTTEYDKVPDWLKPLEDLVRAKTAGTLRPRGGLSLLSTHPFLHSGQDRAGYQILNSIECIVSESRQAKFYYLKGALRRNPNIEVENDKAIVENFLESLNFDSRLITSLRKSEELYRADSELDLKSCLDHLRSFFEHLHIDAAQLTTDSSRVGDIDGALNFLRNSSVLSQQQEKFARGLYTLLSSEGAHSLIASREFARLLRNMVIEYGLLFLTVLSKSASSKCK